MGRERRRRLEHGRPLVFLHTAFLLRVLSLLFVGLSTTDADAAAAVNAHNTDADSQPQPQPQPQPPLPIPHHPHSFNHTWAWQQQLQQPPPQPPQQHPQSQRNLQSSALNCVATALDDFRTTELGPVARSEFSVFNNIGIAVDANGSTWLPIPVELLALYLLEYRFKGGAPWPDGSSMMSWDPSQEFFGRESEHTERIRKQHTVLTLFWNIPPEEVLLIGLHSEPLRNHIPLAVEAWLQLTGLGEKHSVTSVAMGNAAAQVQTAIETELPGSYSNPVLSNTAFHVPFSLIVGYERTPAIFFGDGYLDFYTASGYANVGSDVLHAHELAHQVQFIHDLALVNGDMVAYGNNRPVSYVWTRQRELEADSMAAYALAHASGRNVATPLVVQVAESAYAIGDCQVWDNAHHGTPAQRECAAQWGADEGWGNEIGGSNPIMTYEEFHELFLSQLDGILELDEMVCALTDDQTPPPVTTTASPVAAPVTAVQTDAPVATPVASVPTPAAVPISVVMPTTDAPVASPAPTSAPVDPTTGGPIRVTTGVPRVAPTNSPTTVAPTSTAPVPVPTSNAPIVAPTDTPITVAPTTAPVVAPTIAPIVAPTIAPVPMPTDAPVASATTSTPTVAPAKAPITGVTKTPAIPITPALTRAPTSAPVATPVSTAGPTAAPTATVTTPASTSATPLTTTQPASTGSPTAAPEIATQTKAESGATAMGHAATSSLLLVLVPLLVGPTLWLV